MDQQSEHQPNQGASERQPIFMLPGVIAVLLGLIAAVHLARMFVLNESGNLAAVVWLGFVPARLIIPDDIAGGLWPLVWTPFTHAFLHAGWEHLLINGAWLAIFGTPVARRYGVGPTLILFLASSAMGAAAFAATTLPEGVQVLVGASGGISGLTGAACRFMFQPVLLAANPAGGPPLILGRRLASLRDLAKEPRARGFIVIWIILNAAVPLFPMLIGQSLDIAWQAHLGGFLTGLFLVPAFERGGGRT